MPYDATEGVAKHSSLINVQAWFIIHVQLRWYQMNYPGGM